MDCVNNESFYLKEDELKFLLSGLGITELYGLFSDENEEICEPVNIHQMLVDLYQKKVVVCDGNQITVMSPFSKMLEIIVRSVKCVTMRRSTIECPLRCCYMTTAYVVVMEKSQREACTIRLYQMSVEEWLHFVLVEIDEEDMEMQLELLSSTKNIFYEKILFKENGIQNYLILENKKEQIQMEYQKEKFIEKLREWVGGNK